MTTPSFYQRAEACANALESSLKTLGHWDPDPLPESSFENMGAFGSETMTFFQWLQFVLIPTIHDIVREQGEFPSESHLSAYAVRALDGDPYLDELTGLLWQIDELINSQLDNGNPPLSYPPASENYPKPSELPEVVYLLAGNLPEFEGEQLEAQLQSFDAFLSSFSDEVRPVISKLLKEASLKTTNAMSRDRIAAAAKSIDEGGSASIPFDHESAMRKYQEEFRKSYPSAPSEPA